MIPYARRRNYGFSGPLDSLSISDPNKSPMQVLDDHVWQMCYQSGMISLNEVLLAMGQDPVPGGHVMINVPHKPIEPYSPQPEYEEMLIPYPEEK